MKKIIHTSLLVLNLIVVGAFLISATTGFQSFLWTDITLTGQGTEASPAKVDTSVMVTTYAFKTAGGQLMEIMKFGGASYKAVSMEGGTINNTGGMTDGQAQFTAIVIPYDMTISGVSFYQGTQGSYTADNTNQVGLYTLSAGTLTLVASSTDNGNLWKGTSNSFVNEPFTTPYAATEGVYWLGLLYNSSSQSVQPTIGRQAALTNANAANFGMAASTKVNGQLAGQTALPASQAMSGITGQLNVPWVAVY